MKRKLLTEILGSILNAGTQSSEINIVYRISINAKIFPDTPK
jgi:hypothetical protein